MSTDRQARFGAPEHGAALETVACDVNGWEYVDGASADARNADGDGVQVKGCRVEHSNGGDETVPGRWDCWSEPLLHLLHDGGYYLVLVYDGEVDPDDMDADRCDEYVLASRLLTAQEFGQLIDPDSWHDAHRDKGQRARVPWTSVFDREDVEGGDA